ncbi:type II secretion system protein [Desulfofarcimen acetoxidans DSM 771]|uniref:Type II secretion system protein n=1 Tax=Desulfofarcimen acetoxidans (strain ATCC 49208 / DSM 771 / KCTC 5769 / VKM B-1644 / 5575) TaxID=485916 RepID=C8W150_DESAS|nr:type II secretion system F family protein [Desulfofarcimen acetoxidans]ACV63446.1 type II secretion system protein [Desulfofarcimen acetoxidans DSM 771]
MPQYSYQVVGRDGKTARGTFSAGSLSEAVSALRGQGLAITSIKEQEGQAAAKTASVPSVNLNDLLIRLSRVKQSDVVILLWQLAALITAGVSIVASLVVLEQQSRNRRLKFILSSVRRDVEAGKALSDAMIQFPGTFPIMVTSILKTGETTGLLDTAMERVAKYWEERLELMRKVISSSLYPAIVLLVSLGVIIFMVSYVLPKLAPFLESMGGEMPWNTRLLIDIAGNASANLGKLGIGLGCLVVVMAVVYYLPAGRYFIDRYKTRIPLMGPIFQYTVVVHFAKTLALLVSSGVSVLEALKATRETISNTAVKKVIERMVDRVLRGENLSDPLLRAGNYFPPMVGNMVKVGEETGSVDSSLLMVADIYGKLLQAKIDKMISLMEPILIVVLGGIVGFIAAALVGAMVAGYGNVQ